jgi:acetyltransferase-like isoleucine patch superfamily enzyme
MKKVRNCTIDPSARISDFVNLYECEIAADAFIGPFVEIQRGVVVGRATRVSSHTFICEGVTIGEDCFVGHGAVFTNDLFDSDRPGDDWILRATTIGDRVRIGSNATLLPVTVGDDAIIGAGAVVTRDVPRGGVVVGNPARLVRSRSGLQDRPH